MSCARSRPNQNILATATAIAMVTAVLNVDRTTTESANDAFSFQRMIVRTAETRFAAHQLAVAARVVSASVPTKAIIDATPDGVEMRVVQRRPDPQIFKLGAPVRRYAVLYAATGCDAEPGNVSRA